MKTYQLISIGIIAAALLAGCGKEEQAANVQKPAAQAGASLQGEPRYEATIAQGIDFRKPGYPTFLVDVTGMSFAESVGEGWGRWTDGPQATFKFKTPLSGKIKLVVVGHAYGQNAGNPVKVKIGDQEGTLTLDAAADKKVEIPFSLDKPADTLTIVIPRPTKPEGGDRLLGLGLVQLQIVE